MRHAVRRSNLLPLAEAAGPDGTGGASSRETGPKPQRWLPQEAPLFTRGSSHAAKKLTGSDCGGIYPRAELLPRYHHLDDGYAPKVNSARPAGEWQTLDLIFKAPRFDRSGKKGSQGPVSGDTNSDPLPPVLIPTPIMPSCYRLSTPLSGSFLVLTSVSRWVCSESTFVNLDRINPLLRFSRSR